MISAQRFGDSVKCFCCGGELKSWRTEEDPIIAHGRYFPACCLVVSRLQRLQSPIFPVDGFMEMSDANPLNEHPPPVKSKEEIDSGCGCSLSSASKRSTDFSAFNSQVHHFAGTITPGRNGNDRGVRRSIQVSDIRTLPNSRVENSGSNSSNWRRVAGLDVLLPSGFSGETKIHHMNPVALQQSGAVVEPCSAPLESPTTSNNTARSDVSMNFSDRLFDDGQRPESKRYNYLPSDSGSDLPTMVTFDFQDELCLGADFASQKHDIGTADDKDKIFIESTPNRDLRSTCSSILSENYCRNHQGRNDTPNTSQPMTQQSRQLPHALRFGRLGIHEIQLMAGRIPHPLYPEYEYLSSRISSFLGWPGRASADLLALAGFFYTGFNDCVQCFHFGSTIQMWEFNENAVTEHLLISPCCRFAKSVESMSTNMRH